VRQKDNHRENRLFYENKSKGSSSTSTTSWRAWCVSDLTDTKRAADRPCVAKSNLSRAQPAIRDACAKHQASAPFRIMATSVVRASNAPALLCRVRFHRHARCWRHRVDLRDCKRCDGCVSASGKSVNEHQTLRPTQPHANDYPTRSQARTDTQRARRPTLSPL
jgi:hypothetical protein